MASNTFDDFTDLREDDKEQPTEQPAEQTTAMAKRVERTPSHYTGGFRLQSTQGDWREAREYCKWLAPQPWLPEPYRNNPGNCYLAISYSTMLGIPEQLIMEYLTVINNRRCLWGDLLVAICRDHPTCEYIHEYIDDRDPKNLVGVCILKRRGGPQNVYTFSEEDARNANLLNKGTWKSYRKWMLLRRARGFGCRSVFPDALFGLQSAEEQRDVSGEYHILSPGGEGQPDVIVQKRADADKVKQAERAYYAGKASSVSAAGVQFAEHDAEEGEQETTAETLGEQTKQKAKKKAKGAAGAILNDIGDDYDEVAAEVAKEEKKA